MLLSCLVAVALTAEEDLIAAAKRGDLTSVTTLIKTVDINKGDPHGNNPLHWASWHGHDKVVSALLEAGAIVDKKDGPNDGNTALMKVTFGILLSQHSSCCVFGGFLQWSQHRTREGSTCV